MRRASPVLRLCGIGIVLCGATTATAVTSCFFHFVVECCNLVTSGPVPTTRQCGLVKCADILHNNSISHFQAAPVGQPGYPTITPTDPFTCSFDRYQCSIAGNCVIQTANVTNTATPSIPSGTYGSCTG